MLEYQSMSDDQLIELLYTEEDRLPRAAVDEFIRRGERVAGLLSGIAADPDEWRQPDFDQWAAVHATFILGAIGAESVVLPLLKALRHASAYDDDWVSGDLPAILGKIGRPAMGGLRYIAQDRTSDWVTRATAMSGLEAVAVNYPDAEDEAAAVIGAIFRDGREEPEVRGMAALNLLNLLRADYKADLLSYARKEAEALSGDSAPFVNLSEAEVLHAFASGKKRTADATRDWLAFYDEEQVRERQERWAEEFASDGVDADDDEVPARQPFLLERAKVGRNEPCPCGSGKKFKKCCLGKERDDRNIPF